MSTDRASPFAVQHEDAEVAALFENEAWLAALVRTEVALVRAQAKARVIPEGEAIAIADRLKSFRLDSGKLAAETQRDGFPIIGLVAQIREHVGGEAAEYVHYGATTQDILDTALVCQVRMALEFIEARVVEVRAALASLADRYRAAVCIGRTHLQWATPVTFGLKAANWLAPLLRHHQRLQQLRPRILVAQCGGAAGTLASLGHFGPDVIREFAAENGLGVPPMPWNTQRDGILELADWLALLTSILVKFGRDILLLAQSDIAEVRESDGRDRGGSSAMPQKSNPVLCERLLVAAHSAAAHRMALANAPPPELERGTLTWQVEWEHLPRLVALSAGACGFAAQLASGLFVDTQRMQANLEATHGVLLAEAASMALRPHLGSEATKTLVREACQTATAENRHLIDVLRAKTTASIDWDALREEAKYLGSTNAFINAVLGEAAAITTGAKSKTR